MFDKNCRRLPEPRQVVGINEPTSPATIDPDPLPFTNAEARAFAELRQRAQESGAHVFRTREGNGWRYHASRWGWCKAFDTPEAMLQWLDRLQGADKPLRNPQGTHGGRDGNGV